jgi:hypothetical protein
MMTALLSKVDLFLSRAAAAVLLWLWLTGSVFLLGWVDIFASAFRYPLREGRFRFRRFWRDYLDGL